MAIFSDIDIFGDANRVIEMYILLEDFASLREN